MLTTNEFLSTVLPPSGMYCVVGLKKDEKPKQKFVESIEKVEELAKEFEGKAVVGKVDVDSNPEISMKFGIRNIPALLFFKGGEIVDKQIGAVPKSVLAQKLNAQL